MCEEFSGDRVEVSDTGLDYSDIEANLITDNDVSVEDCFMDCESECIFDMPQEIPSDILAEGGEDVYEAKRLDEIQILDENGGAYTVAERMEELYGENPMGEQLTPAQEGLWEFEEHQRSGESFELLFEIEESLERPIKENSEQIEELQLSKKRLENLKDLLLAGDKDALEMFGLDDPNAPEDSGDQKVLRR